jgi:outer membrane protein assembly factor BamA
MKRLAVGLALALSAAVCSGQDAEQPAAKSPPPKIGQVFIVGNEFTRQDVILDAVNFFPGQLLSKADFRAAERNLERLNIFKPGSVEIKVIDDPANPEGAYKDVLINIEETFTARWRLMAGVTPGGEPVVSVVWEERNFDPFRWPTSIEDLKGGGAFRGGGKLLRLELLQVPVLPGRTPRILRVGSFLTPLSIIARQ